MTETHTLKKCCEHWIEYLGKMINYCPECGEELAHEPLTAILGLDCLQGKKTVLHFYPTISIPLKDSSSSLVFEFKEQVNEVTAYYEFNKLETI